MRTTAKALNAALGVLLALCGACAAHDPADHGSTPSSVGDGGTSNNSTPIQEEAMTEHQALQQIALRFTDSSVPPEYHRSYTIVVEAGSVQTKVDVYDDVIASDEHVLDDGSWAKLAGDAQQLPSTLSEDDDGATGGTSYRLVLRTADGQRTLVWSEDRTQGSESVTKFAHQIESLVPNLESLKETKYQAQ
jgi:hypothetical protein